MIRIPVGLLIKKYSMVAIIFFMTTTICNAQALIDGHTWATKMTEDEKVIYVIAYIDGVSSGVGQGVRFVMDTRLPDQKMFKKAFNIWSNIIHFGDLIRQIDNYYKEIKHEI